MKIENNKFYVVVAGKDSFVEKTRAEAIEALKKNLQAAREKNLNPQIAVVDISGDKWSMQALSWQEIAVELLRSE